MSSSSRLMAATLAAVVGTTAMAENRIDRVLPDAPDLAAYGDHRIGVTTLTLTHAGQVDVLNATADSAPTYDRPLTVELWYPADPATTPGGTYQTVIRDGVTPATLTGQAARDAAPEAGQKFPLVIISHGYPGNRMLLSPLAENLASKGYVVASIDHTDSTYSDQAAFGSTLRNRPLDQRFVLDTLATLDSPVGAIIDADDTAVIGYSMGGYGALIFAGAGVTEASVAFPYAPPGGLLAINQAGSDTLAALVDPRVKAVVTFAPWGMNAGFWDAAALAGIQKPLFLIAGSVDDVAVYANIRQIFEATTGTDRMLLTFDNANHNAGAPMPAPEESWFYSETLKFSPYEHYADAVWDTVRMNNISAHFITAFLDLHLKDDAAMGQFLDVTQNAADGVWAVDDAGNPTAEYTYWKGFANRTAAGLHLERRAAGQ